MNEKYLTIIKKQLKYIRYFFVTLWSLLTLIIIAALITKWLNPGVKNISNQDLKEYGIISTAFFIMILTLSFINNSISKKIMAKTK